MCLAPGKIVPRNGHRFREDVGDSALYALAQVSYLVAFGSLLRAASRFLARISKAPLLRAAAEGRRGSKQLFTQLPLLAYDRGASLLICRCGSEADGTPTSNASHCLVRNRTSRPNPHWSRGRIGLECGALLVLRAHGASRPLEAPPSNARRGEAGERERTHVSD